MASAPPSFCPYIKNKETDFEIKSNKGKMFYINFSNQGDHLLISAHYVSNNSKVKFESKFELSYIKNVKLFVLYDTLDECLEEIFSGINTGKSYLVEEDSYINIYIPLNNIKFNEIMFKVDLKNEIDLVNNEKIIELKKVIKEQNKEIINLKEKVEQLEIVVNELLSFKKEISGKISFKITSKILDTYTYIFLLKNWINTYNNFNKLIKSKLLYRLSKDGESVDTFHKLCDNITPTLILIETTGGRKFGAYTTWTWSQTKGGKKDGKTFLFSFDEKKMYKKKKDCEKERDIYNRKDAGPIFGGNDLYFYQTLKKGYSLSPFYFLEKNDLAKNTNDDFDIKEIEIFMLGFE